jgi:type IV pilus biogenesis protein CpaD/CtpE
MKYFTLSILLIGILIAACTKKDNSDPNQILLLSKTKENNLIIEYKYNSENLLVETDHKLSNGEIYVVLYYYTP